MFSANYINYLSTGHTIFKKTQKIATHNFSFYFSVCNFMNEHKKWFFEWFGGSRLEILEAILPPFPLVYPFTMTCFLASLVPFEVFFSNVLIKMKKQNSVGYWSIEYTFCYLFSRLFIRGSFIQSVTHIKLKKCSNVHNSNCNSLIFLKGAFQTHTHFLCATKKLFLICKSSKNCIKKGKEFFVSAVVFSQKIWKF